MLMRAVPVLMAAAMTVCAQESPGPLDTKPIAPVQAAKPAEEPKPDVAAAPKPADKTYQVEPNTRIPLSMISSVSTRDTVPGDKVYLETVFPILVNGKIVIPPGSYVEGTITKVQRPGKVKGRGEFYLRFDTLILPNGVTRDFRARVSSLDGRASEVLDRNEGSIKSEGNKAGDTRTVAETAVAGASIGALAGSAAGATGMGAGIGAAVGAAAGLAAVFFTRGPDAVLAKGTTIEMVLDRTVDFNEAELDFSNSPARPNVGEGSGPLPSQKNQTLRRWPL